ncbi:hypothetical protein X739_32875 [Mesorhizobium sp. LNHC220B00]|nr:hypothetical protein X739_32875 [Mesorhizobium sp. LNHC220B00]
MALFQSPIKRQSNEEGTTMHQVSFPGHAGQPCIGHYAIAIDRSGTFARADIVLVSRHGHEASLLNGN